MYKVYWTETIDVRKQQEDIAKSWYEITGEVIDVIESKDHSWSKLFSSSELTNALQFCEELRRRRRDGAPFSFIGMVSENPDSVGQPGVSDKLPEGYDWTKQDRAGKARRR